jgi:hypothetical protein
MQNKMPKKKDHMSILPEEIKDLILSTLSYREKSSFAITSSKNFWDSWNHVGSYTITIRDSEPIDDIAFDDDFVAFANKPIKKKCKEDCGCFECMEIYEKRYYDNIEKKIQEEMRYGFHW